MSEPIPSGDATSPLSEHAAGAAGVERLSHGVIWAFSTPRIAFGIMALLSSTYLMKFSTDVLLIAPAAMGSLIALSRLWDAISDPLAGFLSDRTRSAYGRRRSWMFFAAIPMGITLVMIWSPPPMLQGALLVAWMAIALLANNTATTAYYVPHGALGVELTPNYHERTRLFGYSHMIGALGSVTGLVALYFFDHSEDKRLMALILSGFAAVCIVGIVLWSTWILPERGDYQGRGATNPFHALRDIAMNPHARLLLIVYAVESFGNASVAMLVPYLLQYVVPGMKGMMVPILLAFTIPQFIFTPLWMRLARIFGKKRLWAFAMGLNSLTYFGFFFAMHHPPLIWTLAFALGFASGCGAVVAPSIKADVIDYDEYMSGQRKEGSYLAVWSLTNKTAAAATALITGLTLQFSGFIPNDVQSETTQFAMRAIFALLPAACYAGGLLLFLRFSFNEPEHSAVREELTRRAIHRSG